MVLNLPGWKLERSGKVRDLYIPDGSVPGRAEGGSPPWLLLVVSDRVSAFDQILEPEIPGKGQLLTEISSWWVKQLAPLVGNHLLPADLADTELAKIPAPVQERATLCRRLPMLPVECVVRGYVAGSWWLEYVSQQAKRTPQSLQEGDMLPEPLFTPTTKGQAGEKDLPLCRSELEQLVGADLTDRLEQTSLQLYHHAHRLAQRCGLILADTKFEFGLDPETGELLLADEVLTCDSSRYWDKKAWESFGSPRNQRLASFDKQIVRNWLRANWAGEGAPPRLPAEIVARTQERYQLLRDRLFRLDSSSVEDNQS